LRLFDLEKSQFLREALELALLSRALERGDRATLLRQLRTEIAVQQAFVEAGDAARFYASDEQFHAAIAEQAGMPTVLPEMARAKTHMDRFRHLTRISQTMGCIEAANQRNLLCIQHVSSIRGAPRCKQSVSRICLDL
jgi:DNA-binding GntR family transcriptional regulator